MENSKVDTGKLKKFREQEKEVIGHGRLFC